MATDFSITTLLDLPSEESKTIPEQVYETGVPIPEYGRFPAANGRSKSIGRYYNLSQRYLPCETIFSFENV